MPHTESLHCSLLGAGNQTSTVACAPLPYKASLEWKSDVSRPSGKQLIDARTQGGVDILSKLQEYGKDPEVKFHCN